MTKKIKIALVEDIKEISDNLREIINEEADMECAHVYRSAEEAFGFLPHADVEIVLLDIGLPGESGIELMLKMLEHRSDLRYCMFTVFETDEKIFESLKAGAKGYILKNEHPGQIIKALRDLYSGGSPMSSIIARRVLDAFLQPQGNGDNLSLTPREHELLHLLSDGLFYKEIAQQLNLTLGTVKQYIHHIYEKLQVNNRTEAINKYLGR